MKGKQVIYIKIVFIYTIIKKYMYWVLLIVQYLHLPSIFPIKSVGGPSSLMRAWLPRYVNEQSATFIVLLSAYEVVDVNGSNAFPYVHFNSKWYVHCKEVRCCCIYDNQTLKYQSFIRIIWTGSHGWICSVRRPSATGCSKCLNFCTFEIWGLGQHFVFRSNIYHMLPSSPVNNCIMSPRLR